MEANFGPEDINDINEVKYRTLLYLKDNGKNRDRSNEVIQDTYKKRYDTKRLTQLD